MKNVFQKKKKRTDEIKNEIDEIKKWGTKTKRKDLKYKAGKYKYDFQQYKTIRFFGESIHSGKVSIHKADMDQTNLAENIRKCNNKSRPKTKEVKDKKNTFDNVSALYEGRELTITAFRSGIFPVKEKQGQGRTSMLPSSFGLSSCS